MIKRIISLLLFLFLVVGIVSADRVVTVEVTKTRTVLVKTKDAWIETWIDYSSGERVEKYIHHPAEYKEELEEYKELVSYTIKEAATKEQLQEMVDSMVDDAQDELDDIGGPDPGNTDPGNTDPGNTDPGNTDPGNTDPGNTDPGNTDPGNTDPGNTDPGDTGGPKKPKLSIRIVSVEKIPDEVLKNKDRANDQKESLSNMIISISEEIDEYVEEKKEERERIQSTTKGDPVRMATGEFVTSSTDVSLQSINQVIKIDRSYQSSRSSNHSFGVGWNFNYDTRIVLGVKPKANEAVEFAKQRIQAVQNLYNKTEATITNGLKEMNESMEESFTILGTIQKTADRIQSFYGGFEKPYKEETAHFTLSVANTLKHADTAQNFIERCENATSKLIESKQALVDINATLKELKKQLVILEKEAALANANQARNTYVVNESDPGFIEYSGNKSITYIDEAGTTHEFSIDTPPYYESTTTYADGSINYYPNGSTTTPKQSNKTVLEIMPDGTCKITQKDKTVRYYSFHGLPTRIVDLNGNEINLSYDAAYQLTKITDSTNREILIDKVEGRISKVTDPAGNFYSYDYDSQGRLIKTTDLVGDSIGFTYDEHLLTSVIKSDGSIRQYFYDENDSVTHTIDEEGNAEYFSFNKDGNYTIYTNPSGIVTKHFYNEANLETKIEYADGTFITFEYDDAGNMIKQVDQLGKGYSYIYDDNNNMIQSIDPDGFSEFWEFNDLNKVTYYKNKDGQETSFEYDSAGNMVTTILADGSKIKRQYNGKGQLLKQIDPSGKITDFSYDTNGYPYTVREDGLITGIMEFDILGNMISATNSLGATTSYTYNKDNEVIQVTGADGSSVSYTYNNRKDLTSSIGRNGTEAKSVFDKRHLMVKKINPIGQEIERVYREDEKKVESIIGGIYHTTYSYNELGYLTESVQQETGIATYYTYDAAGRVTDTTDAEGNSRSFIYDNNDRVIRIIDGENEATDYEYSPGGLLLKTTDPKGNWISYEYDVLGRVKQVSNIEGVAAYYEYDAAGNVVLERDALGNETHYVFNRKGELLEITNSLGDTTTFEYTPTGQIQKLINPAGGVTEFIYDIMGRMTARTNPAGGTRYFSYDISDNLIEETNELGQKTKYTYNELNQVIQVTDNLQNTISYEYDVLGKVKKIILPDNTSREFSYDGTGQMVNSVDALGNVTYIQRDKAGNTEAVINPEGEVKAFLYDGNNRLTDTLQYLERITYNPQEGIDIETIAHEALKESITYDAAGNMIFFQDPKASAEGHGVSYEYDSQDRLVKEISPLGYEKNYTYDRNGNLVAVTDFNGDTVVHNYDSLNRLTKTEYPDSTWKSFEYDNMGNVITARNQEMTEEYSYDSLNRPVTITRYWADGESQEFTYTYDALGNRLSLAITQNGETRTTLYSYDSLNRLVQVTSPENEIVTFAYNALGNLVERINPNGTKTEYSYNPTGTVESILHSATKGNGRTKDYETLLSIGYLYDKANRKQYELKSNQELSVYNYDPAGRLEEVYYPFNEEKISYDREQALELGLPANTRIKNITPEYYDFPAADREALSALFGSIHQPTDRFGFFDPAEQTFLKESLEMDRAGNIVTRTNEWGSVSYTYDAANQMLTAGDINFLYDNNGNLVQQQAGNEVTDYSYNYENRLVGVTLPFDARGNEESPKELAYTYDPSGRRISKLVTPFKGKRYREEKYLYDGYNLVGEYIRTSDGRGPSGGNSWTQEWYSEYYYAGSMLLGRLNRTGNDINKGGLENDKNKELAWYHQDALGSVVMMTWRNRQSFEELSYDAYGAIYDGTSKDHYLNHNPFGFTGKRYDQDLGAYSFVFRDYNPSSKRWMTPDPIKDGNNWYRYVNADPVNYVDHLGLFTGLTDSIDNGITETLDAIDAAVDEAVEGINETGQAIRGAVGEGLNSAINGAMTVADETLSIIEEIPISLRYSYGSATGYYDGLKKNYTPQDGAYDIKNISDYIQKDDFQNPLTNKKGAALFNENGKRVLEERGWTIEAADTYHESIDPVTGKQRPAVKLTHNRGGEKIYDMMTGESVTDQVYGDTFNQIPPPYSNPGNALGHTGADVITWLFFGGGPEDQSTIAERLGRLSVSLSNANGSDYRNLDIKCLQ